MVGNMDTLHYTLVLLILILAAAAPAWTLNAEAQVYRHILEKNSGYNPFVRPRVDSGQTVHVNVTYELLSIGQLSEVDQVLYTVGFVAASWDDDLLKWTPREWDGVERLILPSKVIWVPDIVITNSADTFYHETFMRDFRVELSYTGRVLWSFGGNFATSCVLDMTYYPFDTQVCNIVIDNWAYTQDLVDLHNATSLIPYEDFVQNGEWDLRYTRVMPDVYAEDTHPGKLFPRVIFTLYLHRKPLYYFINIVTPCLFCIVIAIMVFWLPPESGEKVSLGITVLLAFSVFQLVVADNTPKTSDFTPLLSVLMTAIMGMATLSVLTSILVLYLYHHSTAKRAPRWLRRLAFQVFARLLCMRSNVPDDNSFSVTVESVQLPCGSTASEMDKVDLNGLDPGAVYSLPREVASDLFQIRQLLKHIVDSMKHTSHEGSIKDEWKALAMVLDRIFFWMTTITSIIMIPTFLLQTDPT